MSRKEERKIRENLLRYAQLMQEFQARGIGRAEASKRAFDLIVKAAAPHSKTEGK